MEEDLDLRMGDGGPCWLDGWGMFSSVLRTSQNAWYGMLEFGRLEQ